MKTSRWSKSVSIGINRAAVFFFCLIMVSVGIGCDKISIDWDTSDNEVKPSASYVSEIAKTLDDRSKDECLYVYKTFAGGALYVEKNYEKIGTTDKWEILLQGVHKDFDWLNDEDGNLVSKDDDFSKRLSKELEALGFADPKSLNDIDTRTKLVKALNDTAEGALKAAEKKK